MLVLAGILMFFMLEKFLRWHHHHTVEDEHHIHPMGYMNLVADGVHNGIDGLLIGASFLTSMQLGVATTIAVVLHEIPSEICRFGVLVHSGFSRSRALWLNLLSGMVAIVGAVVALLLGTHSHGFVDTMQPLTAGGFIYVAGTDLLPELSHDVEPRKSVLQVLCMSAGVAIMYALTFLE
jgi:zinc and cadmium transporter